MQDKLKSVAESMRQTETELRGVALDCRNANSRLSESSESVLIHPVSSKPFSISVAAVDGGIIADRVHGSDIIIGKSVSVNFVIIFRTDFLKQKSRLSLVWMSTKRLFSGSYSDYSLKYLLLSMQLKNSSLICFCLMVQYCHWEATGLRRKAACLQNIQSLWNPTNNFLLSVGSTAASLPAS